MTYYTFDEEYFLHAFGLYIVAVTPSPMLPHTVRDLDPTTWSNIQPPCVCFKDGDADLSDQSGCIVNYTMPLVVACQLPDEFGGVVTGRNPISTLKGIVYWSQIVTGLMNYSTMIDVIVLKTSSQLQASKIISMAPSVRVDIGEGMGIWQTRELTAQMRFRTLP